MAPVGKHAGSLHESRERQPRLRRNGRALPLQHVLRSEQDSGERDKFRNYTAPRSVRVISVIRSDHKNEDRP